MGRRPPPLIENQRLEQTNMGTWHLLTAHPSEGWRWPGLLPCPRVCGIYWLPQAHAEQGSPGSQEPGPRCNTAPGGQQRSQLCPPVCWGKGGGAGCDPGQSHSVNRPRIPRARYWAYHANYWAFSGCQNWKKQRNLGLNIALRDLRSLQTQHAPKEIQQLPRG